MSERARTFVAITLPEDLREELVRLRERADCGGANVRWSSPETMHLTLKFLGEVSLASVNGVIEACRKAALASAGPGPEVVVESMELFPSPRRPRVVAARVAENEALMELQAAVETGLAEAGFAAENRRYRAHVTVGRIKGRSDTSRLAASLQAICGEGPIGGFDADEMVVFQSELRPQGAVHTPLGRIELDS